MLFAACSLSNSTLPLHMNEMPRREQSLLLQISFVKPASPHPQKLVQLCSVEYTVWSLFLHLLSQKAYSTKLQVAMQQQRLGIFVEAMKIFQPHYE
jgi:hypothetical protein